MSKKRKKCNNCRIGDHFVHLKGSVWDGWLASANVAYTTTDRNDNKPIKITKNAKKS